MKWRTLIATGLIAAIGTGAVKAEDMFETFETNPSTRWTYFADTVMGGVSTGDATFDRDASDSFVRLTGNVSTDNNGGFIQVRRPLSDRLPADTKGVRLNVRGNGGVYFIHLRTKGTRLPWQYYQAPFATAPDWAEVQLPFSAFKPSGQFLRKIPRAETVTSIAIVAFGRDHTALVDVSEIVWF
ncbi:MAG: NADH ubiquinone oxidoreductase [Shimia sp.]|nr:NADH ubiquinone oxidoreductase [Shimia sp.]MCP4824561.1 NADH ubiquinone oxidoreductase [Shimia sp.]